MVPPPKQEIAQETTPKTTQETKPKKRKIIIVKKKRIVKKKKADESKPKSETKPNPKITTEELKKTYLQNLDEKERVAMEIAKDHLKTSFDLEKCIDFKNWSSKK